MSDRDRLAATIRTLRLAGIALVLATIAGGSWTLTRPAEASTSAAVRDVVGIQVAGCGTETIVSEPNGVILIVTSTGADVGALVIWPSRCGSRAPDVATQISP